MGIVSRGGKRSAKPRNCDDFVAAGSALWPKNLFDATLYASNADQMPCKRAGYSSVIIRRGSSASPISGYWRESKS